MAKRKAAVNDIIYELDNDDIVISSDDEIKKPKKSSLDAEELKETGDNKGNDIENDTENSPIVSAYSRVSNDSDNEISYDALNGGKNNINVECIEIDTNSTLEHNNSPENQNCAKIAIEESNNSTLFHEDILISSPASNTDLGVVGCENRTPLLTLRFKDSSLAKTYKKTVCDFILRLIKLHEVENEDPSGNDTDLEVDIWPEDLIDDKQKTEQCVEEVDNIFFIDTAPCNTERREIPKYSKVSSIITSSPDKKEESATSYRRAPTCFNCDGAHPLRDCPLPKDHVRIAEKRKSIVARVGRYHVEDDQKYGHLVPGRISGDLRHALGLKRNELPLYIYRMRVLGYPPGWLEEARISHSGITMFDSTGSEILDPEEEDGQVIEPGSKDKFDIKKILDFPGFNVPASSKYLEEGHLFGLPNMSEQDSKLAMLESLAPNAMKAYKRKRLTIFPSADRNSLQSQVEMDLDSGDETPAFPSIPPLPDEAPPPPPPPPTDPPLPPQAPPTQQQDTNEVAAVSDDPEVIEMMKVMSIPIPEEDLITLDEDDSENNSINEESLSLDDLEKKKKLLISALESDSTVAVGENDNNDTEVDKQNLVVQDETEKKSDIEIENTLENVNNRSLMATEEKKEIQNKSISTPDSKGQVKKTLYGTPLVNIASPYSKLPSDDKFAKDICDVINFENLPNSTGKYKKISSLLKKVKTEVDRIQDS